MLQLQPPDQSKGSMTSSIPLSPCKSSYLNLQATLITPAIYLLPLVSGGLHWGLPRLGVLFKPGDSGPLLEIGCQKSTTLDRTSLHPVTEYMQACKMANQIPIM